MYTKIFNLPDCYFKRRQNVSSVSALSYCRVRMVGLHENWRGFEITILQAQIRINIDFKKRKKNLNKPKYKLSFLNILNLETF